MKFKEVRNIEDEIELLNIPVDSIEEKRAEKLVRQHQVKLEEYYDQILSQNKNIFYVGIIFMLLGLIILSVITYVVVTNTSLNSEIKLIVAILGGINSLFSNFIAIIYLRMNNEISKAVREFHVRLVNTHILYFDNFIISKISDNKLKNDVLKEVSIELAKSISNQKKI